MHITKSASGKPGLQISRREWLAIGNKAGWLATASQECSVCHTKLVDRGEGIYACPKCKATRAIEKKQTPDHVGAQPHPKEGFLDEPGAKEQ